MNSSSYGGNTRDTFFRMPKISLQFIYPNARVEWAPKAIESIKSISLKLVDLAD